MSTTAAHLRLGHAFPHPNDLVDGWIAWTYRLATGAEVLTARDPHDSSAVWTAEEWLGISRDKRPVYSYVGSLHPALGRVGLVLHPAWMERDPHGVSRCDSGGLASGAGGFAAIEPNSRQEALQEISFEGATTWRDALEHEIASAYAGAHRAYVAGQQPDVASLEHARRCCVEYAAQNGITDARRVWTWEARSFAGAEAGDVHAIVLAHEAFKEFEELRLTNGNEIPSHIKIIPGDVSSDAVEYFQEEQVLAALEGL